MKALTLYQPYALLNVAGAKLVVLKRKLDG